MGATNKPIFKMEVDKASLARLEKLFEQLPEKANEALELGCDRTARDLRDSIMHRNPPLVWSGALFNSIETVKMGEYGYGVKMLDYGNMLNDPVGHWISLKPGRKITTWAAAHGFVSKKTGREIKTGSKDAGSMFVQSEKNAPRYRGWIDVGLSRSVENMENAITEKFEELK